MQNRALKILMFLICCWLPNAHASKLCIHEITRIGNYQTVSRIHLAYDAQRIFMDPRDTETVAAVGLSLIRPGDRVLDLGSGSGIPTHSYVLHGGAAYAVGREMLFRFSNQKVIELQASLFQFFHSELFQKLIENKFFNWSLKAKPTF